MGMKGFRAAGAGLGKAQRALFSFAGAGALLVIASTGTQNAVANGDTRSLQLYHTHTRESLTITFKKNGRYDEAALKQLNWFLRDWRKDEPTKMEPRLFDVVWEAYREVDGSAPIHIVSAYRSPSTNNMLRSRSRGVAKHSQHTLGRAMDFFIPGVSVSAVREVGLRLQRGGVGYYPTSGSPFVHLDVGNVRHWPRMTRDQLARVFPDGKTVHLPADGRPMPGYEQALADLQRNGSSVGRRFDFSGRGTAAVASASPRSRSLLSRLLGTDDDEDEEIATRPAAEPAAPAPVPALSGRSRMPAAAREEDEQAAPAPQAAAPVPVAAVAPPARVPLPRAKPADFAPVEVAAAPEFASSAPVPAPVSRGPQMVWVQGPAPAALPAPLAYVPPAQSANPLAANPLATNPLATIDSPMPRPRPAAIGGPKPVPVQVAAVGADITLPAAAPVAAPSVGNVAAISIANRIAGASGLLSRKPPQPQQIAEPAPAPPAATAAAAPVRQNPLFAVANRIATAAMPAADRGNPRILGVTGSTVRADSAGKLPEDYFTDRIAVRDRIALAYASSDISIAPARLRDAAAPQPRTRSAAPSAATRQPRSPAEALLTVKLDAAGWRAAMLAQPIDSARIGVVAPRLDESSSLLAAPARAMPFGFGSDPTYGCAAGRFAGYPVMFIRTIDVAAGPAARSVN